MTKTNKQNKKDKKNLKKAQETNADTGIHTFIHTEIP